MDYLRRAGAKGATAEETSQELKLPPSIVYSILKELRRLNFVFIYPREKRPKNERKRRYLCDKSTWGKYAVETQFLEALTIHGEIESINEILKKDLLQVVAKVYKDFSRKPELRTFLPRADPDNICPKCNRSHEAMEFFYATILRAFDSFVSESREFEEFLSEKKYALETERAVKLNQS